MSTEPLHRKCLRLGARGLRLWWREGTWTAARRAAGKLTRRFHRPLAKPPAAVPPMVVVRGPDRTGGASVPTERKFRVAFIGSESRDFQSMRYRAHHLVEALALAGMEAVFVSDEHIAEQSPRILSHDLIVLARLTYSGRVPELIERARRRGIPLVYDIDDYVFDPWVLPYIESYRDCVRAEALRTMSLRGRCLDHCDYFTASTPYLAEIAATRGKTSFALRNGLSALQLQLSHQAYKQRQAAAREDIVRIGYFSGTRTHQADFRIVYPALMAVLRDLPRTRLMIVGYLDLEEFSGLAPFVDRIDVRPPCDWRELPAEIAQVDINLIPLELTPFNEGKSNLKYFESGLLHVPSIASPTRILAASIAHGHNGLLARNTDEWYGGLKMLIERAEERARLGRNAFEHVRQTYVPEAIAAEAVALYRNILRSHRSRRGIAADALSIVLLLCGPEEQWAEAVRQASELATAGHAVTVHVSGASGFASAAALEQHLARPDGEPRFAVQLGGEVPCCDMLIAADTQAMELADVNRRRAHLTVSLPSVAPGESLASLLRQRFQDGPSARAA